VILLLPLSLLLLFLLLHSPVSRTTSIPVSWSRAVLIWSALQVACAEGLSLVQRFGFSGIAICWSVITLALLTTVMIKRRQILASISTLREGFRFHLKNGFRPTLVVLLAFLALLLLQGLAYPPNTYDSMTYHLARIVHWIGNESLSHYPTHIIRQLYQPPFAELAIAQTCILAGSDLFAASVQWLFLGSTLPVVYQIARQLGLNRKASWLSMLLVITLPMAVLQGSSTQNDLVVAFFIAAATLFCIRSLQSGGTAEILYAALAAGLALLTKGTAYLFLAPMLAGWFILFLYRYGRRPHARFLLQPILMVVIPLVLNAGHFSRNYAMNGQLLGVSGAEAESYQNRRHTPGVLLSNILRNGSLHLAVPLLNKPAERAVKKVHEIAGIAVDDPASTFPYVQGYELNYYATLEDHGGNVIQFLLLIIALLVTPFLPGPRNRAMMAYIILLLLQSLLFCGWLNWQPWHARLHTPLFILAAPFIAWVIDRILHSTLQTALQTLLVTYALLVLTFNYARPLVPVPAYTARVTPFGNRFDGLFALKPSARSEYQVISHFLDSAGIRNPGVIVGGDTWEYPLFRSAFPAPFHPVHLQVNNDSRNLPGRLPQHVACIITDRKTNIISYHELNYRCITPLHSILFLYVP